MISTKQSTNLNPALFIGLGSTGLRMIERLQSFVLEEYGISSLPIFRYVVFETDQEKKSGMDSDIIIVHPTINSTDAVKTAIKKGERDYYDWLDEAVLNIPGGMFVSGAGNIRMAGRLCLWENWQTLASDRSNPGCAAVLQSAQEKITAGKNIQKTADLLNEIYNLWNKPIPDLGIQIDPKPNVYIVGTFCGGTCGGMFIDVAYYIKHLFGLWQKDIGGQRAKVIGIFTVYDANDLNAAKSETEKNQAANCWASLLEYDYYCYRNSRYKTTFPDGIQIDTNERPLDYLYLLSCSGNQTNLRTEDGKPDEKSLANMAAMVLFSEVVEGLLGEKERIRIDRLSKPRALTPNKNQHMASLSTCGFAAFRYPKFRIIEGASSRYAIDLCKKWIGTPLHADQVTNVTRKANLTWNTIKESTRDILIHTPAGLLTDVVKTWFDSKKDELLQKPPEQFTKIIRTELEQFGEGKRYDENICNRQKELEEGIKPENLKGILQLINDEIIKALNEEKNINYVKNFLAKMDAAIEHTIQNEKPNKYPVPDLNKAARKLKPDVWARFLGKTKTVHREMIEDYLEEMKEDFTLQIQKIRDYRIKPVLQRIRQKIGIGQQPPPEWMEAGIRTFKQELDILELTLDNCIKDYQLKANEMNIELERTQDVVIITKGKDMPDDINNLYAQLKSNTDDNTILKKVLSKQITGQQTTIDFHKWLGYEDPKKDQHELFKSLFNAVRDEALHWKENFNIAAEILKRSRNLGVNLCQFVANSLPHMQLKGDLAGITVGEHPEFVAGKDEDDNTKNIKNLCKAVEKCPNALKFDDRVITHMPELDHILLFYKEEALIYMDENLSTSGLFEEKYSQYENYLKSQRKAASRTVHTHRLGISYYNVWIEIRREHAVKLMQIAQEIFSTRNEKGTWKESEIFDVEEESLRLRFKLPDGSNEVIMGDRTGIERLAQKHDSFVYFEKRVKEKGEQVGKNGFIERINKLLDWVEAEAKQKKHPDPIGIRTKKYDEYLNKDNPERLELILYSEKEEKDE
jgi:hypothetical protein